MTMTRARRKRYLDALGIEQWVPRPAEQDGTADMPAVVTSPLETPSDPPSPPPPAVEMPPDAMPPSDPEPVVEMPPDAVPPSDPEPAVEMPSDAVPSPDPIPAMGTPVDDAQACDWDTLQALVRDCTRCALHQGRTHAVFGAGVREADLLVLGEGPGAEEDRRGEAFVGRAGKLLDAMLEAIGRDRGHSVFITNIVKCRPPRNRDPAPEEAAACRAFLDRQLELVRPRAILAVGRVAAQNLLGTGDAVGRLRGRVHRHGPQGTPVVVSYHPAYLLRSPLEKRKAWDDLKLLQRVMKEAQ